MCWSSMQMLEGMELDARLAAGLDGGHRGFGPGHGGYAGNARTQGGAPDLVAVGTGATATGSVDHQIDLAGQYHVDHMGFALGELAHRPGRHASLLAVSYTHLRAHETRHDLVCRLLLEKKK